MLTARKSVKRLNVYSQVTASRRLDVRALYHAHYSMTHVRSSLPTVVSNTRIVQSVGMCRLAQVANHAHGTATNSYNCINIVSVSSLGQLTNACALDNDNVSRGAGGKPGHHWSGEHHTNHVVSHIDNYKTRNSSY
jgi:hypothetical protein